MKAVILTKSTKAEEIKITDVEIPKVKKDWVLIKIKSFGLNHSEKLLREFEIENDYIKKPIIPGIECAGIVSDSLDNDFKIGDKVISFMGGLGRSFDGSYAEYCLAPKSHTFKVNTNLSWEELGAIPETYYTAWGSLFECLDLKKDDVLLIRGATCALGYASIQIAKALGCKVIATTHKEEKIKLLLEADKTVVDDGVLYGKVQGINKVLDLIGAKALIDTLKIVTKRGIVCNTGILGGVYALNNFDPIKDIPNGVYLTGFYSNNPTQEDIDKIFEFIHNNNLKSKIGKIYNFKDIKEALVSQDKKLVDGKIVISVD